MPKKTVSDMIWDDLNKKVEDLKLRVDTLYVRTERSETAGGHPSTILANAPLAANGAKSGDQLFITDGKKIGESVATGVLAYYNPATDSWYVDNTPVNSPSISLPRRWSGWHDESTVIAGGALTTNIQASQMYNGAMNQSPSANADSFTQSFMLRAGTYTLSVLGFSNTNRGIIDWSVDGVSQGTQDWYSAAPIFNMVMSTPITVLYDGYHVLNGTITGQNGAATGFAIVITKMWIVPTTD